MLLQDALKAYDDHLYSRPEGEETKSSVVKGNKLAGSKKLARFIKGFESKVKKTVAALKETQATAEQIALQNSVVKETSIPAWVERRGDAAKNTRCIQLHVIEAVNLESKQKNRLSTPYCKVWVLSLEGLQQKGSMSYAEHMAEYTRAIPNTLNPVWDTILKAESLHDSDLLMIELFDLCSAHAKPFRNDPLLGRIAIPVSHLMEAPNTQYKGRSFQSQHSWFAVFKNDLNRRASGYVNLRVALGPRFGSTGVPPEMPDANILRLVPAPAPPPPQKLSVFIASWNVGNSEPPEDLSSWVSLLVLTPPLHLEQLPFFRFLHLAMTST